MVIAALALAPAHAWTAAQGTWPTGAPIPYWIASGDLGPLPDEDEIAAIHAAFATWSSVECTSVRFVYVGRSPAPLREVDQQNVVSLVPAGWTEPGPLGVQTILDGATRIEVDVALDAEGTAWAVTGADGVETLDLQAGLATVVGRLLGLGDSEDPESTMHPDRLGAPSARSLSDDDVTGICTLYPAVLPGEGRLGDPCADRTSCDDGLECVVDATEAYCAPTCPAGQCPEGYVCLGFEGRRTCARGGCSCSGSTGGAGGGAPAALAAALAAFVAFWRRSRPSSRLVTAVGIPGSTK